MLKSGKRIREENYLEIRKMDDRREAIEQKLARSELSQQKKRELKKELGSLDRLIRNKKVLNREIL